jgi:hypothetical protein
MLHAHSLLWHYLWVAPNLLLLTLGFVMWRRGVAGQFPAFCTFAILSATGDLALYIADVSPAVSGPNFWRIDWANLFVEGTLKCAVIGEIFAHIFNSYASLARLGKYLIRAIGVILVFAAALAAALAPQDSRFGIISGAHLLEQTIYLIEAGLLVFIFLFAAYFHLRSGRQILGISLGLSVSACIHLATFALLANGGLSSWKRNILDFANMVTYHACVLIWFYYLLLPQKIGQNSVATKSAIPLPENNLALWNRELERLLDQ